MSTFSPARLGYPSVTATARVADGIALYGHTPHPDEPEYRPMPEAATLDGVVTSLFASITGPFADTALEPDIEDMLWSLTDVLHRKADRAQRHLDDNESRQRALHDEQDGSEVRSVELERVTDKGKLLLERREALEHMRDKAAETFEDYTGSTWRPRSGSMVNHRAMTAAVIDSRDYISAKRRAETEVLLPAGPKIAFAGGQDCNELERIWAVLDRVHAKHPDMVLIHGGSDRGAEKIAACWAGNRKVPCIAFKPDWNRDNKAAPFKRNDRMLDVMPIGLVVFQGNGITDNIADKARKLGIPLIDNRGYSERPVMPNGTSKPAQS